MSEVCIVFQIEKGVRYVDAIFEHPDDARRHIKFEEEHHPEYVYTWRMYLVNKHKMTSEEYIDSYTDEENEEYLNGTD